MRTRIAFFVVVAGLLGSVGAVVAQLGGSNPAYFMDLCQGNRGRLKAASGGVCASNETMSTVSRTVLESTLPPPTHLFPSGVLLDVATLTLDPGNYLVSANIEVVPDEVGESLHGEFMCQLVELGGSLVDTHSTGSIQHFERVRIRFSSVVQLTAPSGVAVRCVAHNFQRLGSATAELSALPVALRVQP